MNIAYTHVQTIPSTSWAITHNLGHTPVGDVYVDKNGSQEKILPLSVVHTSDNELIISFTEATTGTTRLL